MDHSNKDYATKGSIVNLSIEQIIGLVIVVTLALLLGRGTHI